MREKWRQCRHGNIASWLQRFWLSRFHRSQMNIRFSSTSRTVDIGDPGATLCGKAAVHLLNYRLILTTCLTVVIASKGIQASSSIFIREHVLLRQEGQEVPWSHARLSLPTAGGREGRIGATQRETDLVGQKQMDLVGQKHSAGECPMGEIYLISSEKRLLRSCPKRRWVWGVKTCWRKEKHNSWAEV